MTSHAPNNEQVSKSCFACGLTVVLASLERDKLGQDVFCNGTCKDYGNVDPSCIVLADENREPANRIARALEARLKQVQANALSSEEDEPPRPVFGHCNLFNAGQPGFLGHLSIANTGITSMMVCCTWSNCSLKWVLLARASGGWATQSLIFVNGTNHSTSCYLNKVKAQSLAPISTRLVSMLCALCSTRTVTKYIALAEGLNVHHSQALARSRVSMTLTLLRPQAWQTPPV